MDTSSLLCCYYTFVFPILEYSVRESVADWHPQLLENQVHSVERLCPDQGFWSLLSCCLTVYAVLGLFKLESRLVGELFSTSTRV